MKNKLLTSLVLFAISTSLFGQNVFHNRDFWATKPSVEVVKQKMAEGNDLLEMGPGGWDGPLLAIMADCHLETITFILNQPGIDVNVVTHHSNNYLMWTTQKGNVPVMKLLLAKNSRTDIINSHGQSLLMHAALSGKADAEIYDLCLQNGGDILNDKDEQGKNVMLTAISGLKDVSFLPYFLSRGLSIHDVDYDGNGLFHYATASGNLTNLQELVKLGVKYTPNKHGENAFAFVGRGRGGKVTIELVSYLKNLGLNPQQAFQNGQNLAHTIARIGGDETLLSFLIENKVSISKKDMEGNTPLILASARGNVPFLTFWLKENDVNHTNKQGQTAIYQAVMSNSPEAVQFLIDKGADVKIKDNERNDLYLSLVSGYRKGKGSIERFGKIVEILQKANLQLPTKGQLLHAALDKDDQALLAKLIELGDDVNAKDKDGYTVLHYAAMKSKNPDLLKFLIEKGANAKIKTDLEETVLDLVEENEVLSKYTGSLEFLKSK